MVGRESPLPASGEWTCGSRYSNVLFKPAIERDIGFVQRLLNRIACPNRIEAGCRLGAHRELDMDVIRLVVQILDRAEELADLALVR